MQHEPREQLLPISLFNSSVLKWFLCWGFFVIVDSYKLLETIHVLHVLGTCENCSIGASTFNNEGLHTFATGFNPKYICLHLIFASNSTLCLFVARLAFIDWDAQSFITDVCDVCCDTALRVKPLRNLEIKNFPKLWPWLPYSQARIISEENSWLFSSLQFHFQFIFGYKLKIVFGRSKNCQWINCNSNRLLKGWE